MERIDFKRPVSNDGVISGRADWSGMGKEQGDHCIDQSVFSVSEQHHLKQEYTMQTACLRQRQTQLIRQQKDVADNCV